MHADQKYIQALIENNHTEMEDLFLRYSPGIKKMILKNGGTITDAEDIFQTALLKIHQRALKGFVLTCPFNAFIYLVCKNLWTNELKRKNNSRVTFTDIGGYTISDDVFENARQIQLGNARRNLLEKKLEELGQSCKELLKLVWSGKSQEEVAEILQTSYGYIRKRKSDCLGKLTLLIQKSTEFGDLKWP